MDYLGLLFGQYSNVCQLLVATPKTTTTLVLLLMFFFVISFCVSSAEVAYFSLNYKDINYLKTKQQAGYKRVITLLESPALLLTTLLTANTICTIGIVVLSNHLLDIAIAGINVWLAFSIKALSISIFILVFAQVLPRNLAAQNNIRFAKDYSRVVEIIFLFFKIPANQLLKNSLIIENWLGKRTKSNTREEMHAAINLTTPQKEQDILKGILDVGDKIVKQVMISRLDVVGIEFATSFGDLKKKVEELHYSRLPVYNKSLDEIKGMIHTKDMLPVLYEDENFNWHTLIRPAFFVHEQKLIEDLMKEFQQKHTHFAIVADEFGGTSGIVTLEDILEEVIGEIADEFDEVETGNEKLDDKNYIFEGKTMLTDVCKMMNLPNDTFDSMKGENDSLAGLLLELSGEIPANNQEITAGGYKFTVLEVSKNRIQNVKVTLGNGE